MRKSISIFITLLGGLLAAVPAQATIILLSHTHSVTATYSDSSGASLNYSDNHTETAPSASNTFTGGAITTGASVTQLSSFDPTLLSLQLNAGAFLDAASIPPNPTGRWAQNSVAATSQVDFRLLSPTYVQITGYRDRGLWGAWGYTLTGPSGPIPLAFTSPPPWLNSMDQLNLLPAGDYTLTGSVALGVFVQGSGYDGSHTLLRLNIATVPDSGASLGFLLFGLACPWFFKRLSKIRPAA